MNQQKAEKLRKFIRESAEVNPSERIYVEGRKGKKKFLTDQLDENGNRIEITVPITGTIRLGECGRKLYKMMKKGSSNNFA